MNHQKTPRETKSKYSDKDNTTAKLKRVCELKAGTHKQTQQFSFLALTIFQCSIRNLRTKALLISVQ
jgi:hypothetical protein